MSYSLHPAGSANSEEFNPTAFLLSLSPSQIETVHQGFYDLQTGLSMIADNTQKNVVEIIHDWDSDIGKYLSAHNSSAIYQNYFRKNFVNEIQASLGRNPGVSPFVICMRYFTNLTQTWATWAFLSLSSERDALHHFSHGTATGKQILQIFIVSTHWVRHHPATFIKHF